MTSRGVLGALVLWCAFLLAGPSRADEIFIEDAVITATDEGYFLSADFGLAINARLDEALRSGLSLYFLIEFELERPRWYWFNQRAASRTQQLRLWYHALTRQFRLSSGALSRSFASLEEAERALSRVRNWQIAERGQLASDAAYEAYLRMRLDVNQLPKPFQLSILGNREWTLASDWKRWRYMPAREGAR